TAHSSTGASAPNTGPAQTTASGEGLCPRSVREIVSGCRTTRATRPPVSHAPRTWPSSWTACMPSHEATRVETMSVSCGRRFGTMLPTLPPTLPAPQAWPPGSGRGFLPTTRVDCPDQPSAERCIMTDRERFLRAIEAEPADDAVRLVYADWLEEHGDPDRA